MFQFLCINVSKNLLAQQHAFRTNFLFYNFCCFPPHNQLAYCCRYYWYYCWRVVHMAWENNELRKSFNFIFQQFFASISKIFVLGEGWALGYNYMKFSDLLTFLNFLRFWVFFFFLVWALSLPIGENAVGYFKSQVVWQLVKQLV